jgi:hypothetical protein
VVVCGLHGVGLRIGERLHLAGVRVVVVVDDAPDPRLVRVVRGWGIPHLVGSSRLAETLLEAGVAAASALICVETDDLHTLETALLARELHADLRVVVQLAGRPDALPDQHHRRDRRPGGRRTAAPTVRWITRDGPPGCTAGTSPILSARTANCWTCA